MRVLIGLCSSRVLVKSFVLGGDFQRGSLNHRAGYSARAQRTGKPSIWELNSQSMQKTTEGGYRQKSHNSSGYGFGVVFSIAVFRLVISAFAFLIKSPIVSFVGIAAPSDNANAF